MDQVVQKLDCAIYQINIYPLESGSGFHPLVSDLADGQRYPSSEQPGPGLACENGRFPWLLSWSQFSSTALSWPAKSQASGLISTRKANFVMYWIEIIVSIQWIGFCTFWKTEVCCLLNKTSKPNDVKIINRKARLRYTFRLFLNLSKP